MEHQVKTRMVEANGLTFEVDECGTGSRFALLLHGFPESKFSWRYQIPVFVEHGYRVWAPNLRGYGKTSKPEGIKAYRIEELVADVAGLIDAAGATETLLVAHDWGAAIAWNVAMRRTRPLERLIIMNVPHPACFLRELTTLRQLRRSWYMFAFQLPWIPEFILRRNGAETVHRAFREMAVDKSRFPREVTEEYCRNVLIPGTATAMVNYYRAAFRTPPRTMSPKPGTIDTPTLVVWGMEDKALSLATTYDTDRYVSDLTIRYLPGVSHWVQQEAPERVNAIIEAWLEGKPVPEE